MTKTFTVATQVQAVVFQQVLLPEITGGFWQGARPVDHASAWVGVNIVVGTELGATGFQVPRNYNFVNPDFFKKNETALLAAAATVEPSISVKQLKKQLIALNQIMGSRLVAPGGAVSKLPRGRKVTCSIDPSINITTREHRASKTTVRKVAAHFVEGPVDAVQTTVETSSAV